MGYIAAAGNAIIFMFATLGAFLFLLYFLAYLSHCFLVTLDGTAAGADEVTWPDEPVFDWLWKFAYLGWLMTFWSVVLSVPAALVAALLEGDLPWFCGVLFGLVWLVYPVSLLSSLSSNSWAHLFRWPVIGGLLRRWPALLWVYLVSALLTAGAAGLVLVALRTNGLWYLLLAGVAPVLAAVLLIDARLLGRIAWLIGQKPLEEARRQERRERNQPVKIQAQDPWAVEDSAEEVDLEPLEDEPTAPPVPSSPEPEEEWAPPQAYGLEAPGAKRQQPKPYERPWYVDEVDGYEVAAEMGPRTIAPVPLDGYRPVGDDTEVEPSRQRKQAKRPSPRKKPRLRWPLLQGVFTFPWYPTSLSAWGYLSVLAFLHLLLLKTMLLWWPW